MTMYTFQNTFELEQAITTFSQAILWAATQVIPVRSTRRNYLIPPPYLLHLWNLKNLYQRRFQRTQSALNHKVYLLFVQIFSTCLSHCKNTKWSTYLTSLHSQSSQFWKLTRYFSKSPISIPPVLTRGCNLTFPLKGRNFGPTVRKLSPPHPHFRLPPTFRRYLPICR